MRNRTSLRKTLTRFHRCLRLFQARIRSDCMWTVNSDDKMEMIDVTREVVRLRSAMLEMSNQLSLVSRQMSVLIRSKSRCVPISSHPVRGKARKAPAPTTERRHAFGAIPMGKGGVVVGVLENVAGFSFQQQYGEFESWTEAQSFAALLNERFGVKSHDALEVLISSDMASKITKGKRPPLHIFLNS